MELLLHQLERTLSQAAEIYEDLVLVSRSKQEAIIGADLEGLELAVKAEGDLIEAAQREENLRLRVHQAIARQMRIAPEDLNIEKLIESWTFYDTSSLEKAHTRLKTTIGELKTITEANSYLADSSLKLLNEIRRAVLQPSEEQTYYGSHGAVETAATELALVDVAG